MCSVTFWYVRVPTCHPEKKYGSNGLCRTCSSTEWHRKHPGQRWRDKHPERRAATRPATDKAWRAANPAKQAQYTAMTKARYARARRQIQARKDRPCMDCGVQYPYYVMQFDHRDPATKLFIISMARAVGLRLDAEMDKCDVVCANCHAIRSHTSRQKISPVSNLDKPHPINLIQEIAA
jgi:hypothetical protein